MKRDPFSRMANIIHGTAKGHAQRHASLVTPELGTIREEGLQIDALKFTIPDYYVSEHLVMEETDDMYFADTDDVTQTVDGQSTIDPAVHKHKVVTPLALKPLKPGDRVLVIPVLGGNEYVVIAKVVKYGG